MELTYDLSWLVISTIIGIDNHIVERATQEDYNNIKKLSKELYKTSKSYISPDIEIMLAEVIWPNKEDRKCKKSEDVSLQTWFLAKELETLTKLSRNRQKDLKNTCIKLHEKIINYEFSKSIYRYVA